MGSWGPVLVLGCGFNPWGPSASVSLSLQQGEGAGVALAQQGLGCPIPPAPSSLRAHPCTPGCSWCPEVAAVHKRFVSTNGSTTAGLALLQTLPPRRQAKPTVPSPLPGQGRAGRGALAPTANAAGAGWSTAPLVTLLLSLPFRNTQVSHAVLGTNVSARGAK